MEYKTEQEKFWAEEFGDEYSQRNTSIIKSNINFFSKVFSRVENVNSVIEFGSNIGMNLHALNTISNLEISAIEINKTAVNELQKLDFLKKVYNESLLDINLDKKFDMTFIKGVLIHINPEYLDVVYEKLYNYSNRYILVAEYYNPTPVEIPYRGNEGKLFKRDFAGEILDKYDDLELVDYGFLYHRDNNFPQDDISWFLLEKR
ncbi:pseudaminic acid biosynthesis-associated methylase [Malaciobacter marinus]|uniref:pseudaminic acid biosynthesis-associated methylase n=1 Tax=Malaciobacter marinus TaxID=505249 RepID=UPI0009D42B71|nr:pseudaminic acid biosynthesis-associated methylase [Malaciobacter marinus]SKB33390.1 pseudaminic acid biosynthesis-associated methylase [Malaciobacter marinus]